MNPDQQIPGPANNYDFIMKPEDQAKAGSAPGPMQTGNKPFIMKLVFIVGGAIVVMVTLAILANVIFGGKTSLDSLVSLAQTEQEIIRLSEMSKNAITQPVKNAAVNTELALKTEQQELLAFAKKYGRNVDPKELVLKKNSRTDNKLEAAKQASTFDTIYSSTMRTELESYAREIRTAYNGATNKQQRTMLNEHYGEVQLLLKQWPE